MNDFSSVPVVFSNLPTTIHGFVTLGEDYEPVIIINSNLPSEVQQKTYMHEIDHLQSGQFDDEGYYEYESPHKIKGERNRDSI